jgi:hypothetical protein
MENRTNIRQYFSLWLRTGRKSGIGVLQPPAVRQSGEENEGKDIALLEKVYGKNRRPPCTSEIDPEK